MIRRLILGTAAFALLVAGGVTAAVLNDPVINRPDPAVLKIPASEMGSRFQLALGNAPASAPAASAEAQAPTASATTSATEVGSPITLAIPDIGLNAPMDTITSEQAAKDGGIDPVSMDRPAWYSAPGAGEAPGTGVPPSSDANTIYVYGHTWNKPAVFNDLKKLSTGDEITLAQGGASVRYRVSKLLPPILKQDLPANAEYSAAVPGRLVLVGCWRATGKETKTTENIVVIAERI